MNEETPIQKTERLARMERETKDLAAEVARQQSNCRHNWGETVSDPIVEDEWIYSHLEGHGSDPIPRYKKGGKKYTPRWKRTCSLCGKVEYTQKEKTVQTGPDFGS